MQRLDRARMWEKGGVCISRGHGGSAELDSEQSNLREQAAERSWGWVGDEMSQTSGGSTVMGGMRRREIWPSHIGPKPQGRF